MNSKLEQLKTMTTVVADTGDIDAIRQWRPEDATTNPSLLLKAAASEAYRPMLEKAVAHAAQHGGHKSDRRSASHFPAGHPRMEPEHHPALPGLTYTAMLSLFR